MRSDFSKLWPPFGLRLSCGPIELSAIRDSDLLELVDAAADIHPDSLRPFPENWAGLPADARAATLARKYWAQRSSFSPNDWQLSLVVRLDGQIVGVQGAEAKAFPALRTPDTYSWLARGVQGRGVGTLMRQIICSFLFDELGATAVTSGAYDDNPASIAVSKKVGYVPNGRRLELRDGVAAAHTKFILHPSNFVRPPLPVEIHGADQFRAYLGLQMCDPGAAPQPAETCVDDAR
ncbi:GNAT family N-acetyltransferase [uncultured Microbacterium sp.]|uniref:GNAT family N-acetyltransferase n=1 Tax=uncultured Microbacterium sp. TaxID=191216 RepID=UPI0035CBE1F1